MHYVFVYGTLRRGEANAGLMRGAVLAAPSAATAGWLYDTGHGYPALVTNAAAGGRVRGELYEVTDETLRELDRLEDYYGPGDSRNEYERVRVSVETEREALEAWAYAYAKPKELSENGVIEGGDWVKHRRESGEQALKENNDVPYPPTAGEP